MPIPSAPNDLTRRIARAFYRVYDQLGPGFLESVYENALALVLHEDGLAVEQQYPIHVHFHGHLVGGFRADLLVERAVIVELKAARVIDPAHEAQLLNYLRATDIEIGLLLNFGPQARFRQFVYSNERKRGRIAAAR